MRKNSQENLYTSALHSIWCTHRDLKNLIFEKRFLPQEIFEKILQKTKDISIFFGPKRFAKIFEKIQNFNLNAHFDFIERKNISLYSLLDDDFPEKIIRIHQVPFIIYTLWSISQNTFSIGIVGSRKNTSYGEQALRKIMNEIPETNLSIISGGAYGIDSLAHSIAIEKKLHTIAVFGCGIDVIYPKSNTKLFTKILESGGGLLSSFPIGTMPETYNFPIRNEIVAWLSDSILIPEAGIKSGTLITARLALDLGKDVFAIPGDIFSETSAGCNLLIRDGEAFPILSGNDLFPDFEGKISKNIQTEIFETKSPKLEKNIWKNFISENSEKIFNAIKNGNYTIDSIFSATGLPIDTISIELTMLELSGDIQATRPGHYQCNF